MKSSAIPVVGDCGFSFFASSLGGVFSVFGEDAPLVDSSLKALNVSENLDKSFKKESICSESFNCDISGFTLSAKLGFCAR